MSAPPPAPSFQERFAAIQREWQALLPQRLREAGELVQALQAAPADSDRQQALLRLLHTLAGSAGTFGRAGLGTQARALEHEVARVIALASPVGADYDTVSAGVQALAREAAAP